MCLMSQMFLFYFIFYEGAMEVLWFFLGVLEHLLALPSAAHAQAKGRVNSRVKSRAQEKKFNTLQQ